MLTLTAIKHPSPTRKPKRSHSFRASYISKMDHISVVGVEYRPIGIEDYSSLMSGDIIWTPKSSMLDCIAYLIVDNQINERPYNLTNMAGYKAGLRLVSFFRMNALLLEIRRVYHSSGFEIIGINDE